MSNPLNKIAQKLRTEPRRVPATPTSIEVAPTLPSGWTAPRTGGVQWQGAATPSTGRAA